MTKYELGNILIYEQPTKYIVKSENYDDLFPVPVLTPGQTFILGYTAETEGVYSAPLPVIIFDDFTTATKLVNFPFKVKSSAMKILKPANENVFLPYWYYFLSSLKVDNGLHKRYWISTFANRQVHCPSFQEQKRIAERLDKVQELIAKQKEQIAKLDLLIKSRFLDMFGDPITNPKNWPLFPLGKFISISGGFAFPSSEFKESGLPIVRIGNINSGVFKDDHFVFYQENEKLRKYLVYPDDLVLSLTGTVGKDDYANICFIGKKYARYYLNQRNAKLVLTSNLDKTFIWQIFKSPEIKKRLTSLNRGVRQANISNQDILNLKVIYPDLFLQTQFANFVKSVEQQKEVFSARLSNLEVLYKSLMQEYFG